jgi:hypothetical protein
VGGGVSRPQGGGGGVGFGLGVGLDLGRLLAGAAQGGGNARTWETLRTSERIFGDGPVGRTGGYVYYDPALAGGMRYGVQLDATPRGAYQGTILWQPSPRLIAFRTDGRLACPGADAPAVPCPEAEEVARLREENRILREAASAADRVCEATRRDCEMQLATARAEADQLRGERDAARALAAQAQATAAAAQAAAQQAQAAAKAPGDGARAIYLPMGTTIDDQGREIDSSGIDIIRLYIDENGIRLDNQLEEYLRAHPELPRREVDFLRSTYGAVPEGGFDFGALPNGANIQHELTRLCEPPPSLEELKALADRSPRGVGESAHIFAVAQHGSEQQTSKKIGGQTVAQSSAQVRESVFNIDLSAECLWVYDKRTGEVKKQYQASLSVQYTDQNGRVREVKYTAHDPQMGWVVS